MIMYLSSSIIWSLAFVIYFFQFFHVISNS